MLSEVATYAALKTRLAACARAHGAVAFGVTRAEKSALTQARLSAALERGDVATWSYDEQWTRQASDPQFHLAAAERVICIAVPYAHPAPRVRLGTGLVSSYAWSTDDYHQVMHEILEALVRLIREYAEAAQTKVICDTRPLAERAFAAAAGVGWVGKHTNLIVPGVGSYVFLGEILVSLPLPLDTPRLTHCGGCRRCVVACPTGALRGDYTMDVKRCIADLTQVRGSIPRPMRPLMGMWVWGCDLCQTVCPPTQRGGALSDPRLAPAADAYPDLLRLLVLNRAEFERRYRRSSMNWRGPAILRRNAAIALGNTLDRATVVPLLEAFEREGSIVVREHIAWALTRIGSPRAAAGARRLLTREAHPAVRRELEIAARTGN